MLDFVIIPETHLSSPILEIRLFGQLLYIYIQYILKSTHFKIYINF